MIDPNMPLWIDLFEDNPLEQLDDMPEGEDLRSWCARAVDEIIAEEEDDDPTYQNAF